MCVVAWFPAEGDCKSSRLAPPQKPRIAAACNQKATGKPGEFWGAIAVVCCFGEWDAVFKDP